MVINEAIDTCPVDCIHWISFEELIAKKEEEKARAAYQEAQPTTNTLFNTFRIPATMIPERMMNEGTMYLNAFSEGRS